MRYRIDDFQETYFVLGSLEELLDLARIDFSPLYSRVQREPDIEPGEVLPDDNVVTRGAGTYPAARRRSR